MLKAALVLSAALCLATCAPAPMYDIVIANGRVMDPESGLDAVRNVGIQGDKVAAISEEDLAGTQVLDAAGHVVTAGFIDLHRHGHSAGNYRAQVQDGITSALELEIGVDDIDAWYAEREDQALVNHGATISHPYTRNIVMSGMTPNEVAEMRQQAGAAAFGAHFESEVQKEPASEEQIEEMRKRLAHGLSRGAAGIGFGLAYTPGATSEEILAMFRLAAEHNATCFVHIRTSRTDASNVEEVIEYAKQSGAPLHIVHINSSGTELIPEYLDVIQKARDEGVDVTTECYPYNRGSTFIESRLFDDWETYEDEEFGQYIWVDTGETLTRETFAQLRKQGGILITPPAYSMEKVKFAIASPLTMIASDGMWLDKGRAHPRTFGTYTRILGRYVREEGALSLMDALAKMSLRPARRLEPRVPVMKDKGRVRVGADADLVVFNPDTVMDQGTFEDPAQPPQGIHHVLVNGTPVLVDGSLVDDKLPGRALRAPVQ